MSKLFFYRVVTACALGVSLFLMVEANQVTTKLSSEKPTQEMITTDQFSPQAHARLVLGSGCFWGAEKGYEALPGVIDAVSGYADGQGVEPSYREITRYKHRFNPNNHAEVVEVTYDPNVITTVQLLQHFFEHHDPTQSNRQGNDVGIQYRSTILYTDEHQAEQANGLLAEYQGLLTAAGFGKIQTAVKSLTEFYPAEDYHQDYIAKKSQWLLPRSFHWCCVCQ